MLSRTLHDRYLLSQPFLPSTFHTPGDGTAFSTMGPLEKGKAEALCPTGLFCLPGRWGGGIPRPKEMFFLGLRTCAEDPLLHKREKLQNSLSSPAEWLECFRIPSLAYLARKKGLGIRRVRTNVRFLIGSFSPHTAITVINHNPNPHPFRKVKAALP